MIRLLHISDLHFHRGQHKNKPILRALTIIEQRFPEHYLVITGDITDDGHDDQYKRAQDALLPFQDRLLLCPGNHDGGPIGNIFRQECLDRFNQRMIEEYGREQIYDTRPVVHILQDEALVQTQVMLIGLNSVLSTQNPFDFACGKIGWLQRWRLDRLLLDAETCWMPKILYFHHHPFYHGLCVRMLDAKALLREIAAKCEMVLFGHRHRSGLYQQDFVEYFLAADNLPDATHVREICINQHQINIQKHTLEE